MSLSRRQLLCTPLLAALPALASATPLRMVVVDLMPWAGRNADGQLEGVSVDLASQLSSLSGLPLVIDAVPYARAIAMLRGDGADLMLAIAASPAHTQPPLATLGTEDVIVVGRRGTHFSSADQLCGHRVALLRRASFADSLHACIARYETNSYEQGLRMLHQGRLDGVAGVRTSMDYAIHHLGYQPSDYGVPLVVGKANLSLYLADQNVTPAMAARLQQACLQLQRKKQMPALLAQYRQIRN
ncbi:transporter substrate-binding domain-containing protein [Duganella sp. sic0402]|uniref:substrate-binding periplasmic protein n=1 Tax=Duganella sp. sic0402 TaxID=2854786 RepID=UPI001C44F708|nr:transporter substrate-binding domain-containing protein [Duganella sp. sic0402]MBV7534181.1 transporter substrate-binding domain-containing protein [Duganella sp. sic0402]